MDSESDELASLKESKEHGTDNTPLSFNNASISFQQVESTSRLRSPSDFVGPPLDYVDRTRVEYVPLTRAQRDFSKEAAISVETSPRLLTARTDQSGLSSSRVMKANTINLSCVSSASVSSLPLAALSRIAEQRKGSAANTARSTEKSYYQDLQAPIYERTQRWRTSSTSRLSAMKTQNLEKEISECSFAPTLAPKTREYTPTESVQQRTQRWQEEASRRLLQSQVLTTQAKVEEELASDCPFRPTLLREDSPKSHFDGKKFYTKNLEWKKQVMVRAQWDTKPPLSPPVKMIKHKSPPHSPDFNEASELQEFKKHAAFLSRILKGEQKQPTKVRLKPTSTDRKTVRQELLVAKIALLEEKVALALDSRHSATLA